MSGVVSVLLAVTGAYQLNAAEWHMDVVDQSGSAMFTSMKIDRNGDLHVAYVPDVQGHPLRYAYWDHNIKHWFTMTVAQYASFCTLTLDSKQRPHISYADHGTGLGARLRHAWWDGNAWHVDPITIQAGAVVAYYTSIALDKKDSPVFSYYDYADPGNNFRLRMRTVFWMGNYWEARTVDPRGGSGKFNSLAMDSRGFPHLAYANVKYENSGLWYATWNGQDWKTEAIEGMSGPCPAASVALLLDANDVPHIAYTLGEKRLIKYATRVNGKWTTEVVDGIGREAYPDRNGIALDSEGNPYVSYYDGASGILKIAHRKNGKWVAEVVDQNYAGATSSLVIDSGMLWISYADELGRGLKVAHRPLQEPLSAQRQDVVPTTQVK